MLRSAQPSWSLITLSPCEALSWWMCARLCIACVYMFLCISVCSAILNPSQQQFVPSLLLIPSRSTRTYLSAFLSDYEEEEEGARSYFGILIIFLLMYTIISKLRVPRALIVEIVCVFVQLRIRTSACKDGSYSIFLSYAWICAQHQTLKGAYYAHLHLIFILGL